MSATERDGWFGKYVPTDADARVRQLDSGNRLFYLVLSKTTGEVKRQVDAYLLRQEYGFSFLAAGLRHLFAHGILTPHANGATPANVTSLTKYMAEALLAGVATDFRGRVETAVAGRAAPWGGSHVGD